MRPPLAGGAPRFTTSAQYFHYEPDVRGVRLVVRTPVGRESSKGRDTVHPMVHPLFFETHATSLDNEAGIASGWFDVELSPIGEAQARELGQRYIDRAVSAVFCSDLRRSYRTAEIAFAGGRVPITRDTRLRECDYGDLTRRPTTVIDALRQTSVTVPFPNGESYDQVTQRVGDVLAEIARDHDHGPVLIIGHRATFFALEHVLRGVPLADAVAAPWRWQPGWTYHV